MTKNLFAISAFGALFDIFLTGFIGLKLQLPIISEIYFFFHAYPFYILNHGMETWKAYGYYFLLWTALTVLIHFLIALNIKTTQEE